MSDLFDQQMDEQLRSALGEPAAADFDAFRSRHSDAVAYLNPVVTAMAHRRRMMIARIASLAVAATIVVAVGTWLFVPRGSTFAQTVQAINKAKTISWTIDWYDRIYSLDGQRTWLRKAPRWERAWMAPSSYRDTKYDDDGNVDTVDIQDAAAGKTLHLNMKQKIATLETKRTGPIPPDYQSNPFAGIARILEKEPIEFVGQREKFGATVSAFRHHQDKMGGSENMEIWLDAKSKQLVGYSTRTWIVNYGGSKDDFFDPATAADRNNPPEPKMRNGQIAGTIEGNIVFDAALDPKLFSLTPPEGFAFIEKKRPPITEQVLIEWLRLTAGANDGMFVDTTRGLDLDRHNAISKKAKADQSAAEQQFLDAWTKHHNDGNHMPIYDFANDSTEPKTFRYLGKGIKLGDADRIVCFYKLKGTNKYRAVYGDLNVKDVDPKDLPLPVDE